MIGRIGLIELGIGLIELGKGLIELGIGLIELGIGLIELGIGLIELGKGLMELGIGLRIITPGAPSWPVYPALFSCRSVGVFGRVPMGKQDQQGAKRTRLLSSCVLS